MPCTHQPLPGASLALSYFHRQDASLATEQTRISHGFDAMHTDGAYASLSLSTSGLLHMVGLPSVDWHSHLLSP